MLTKQKQFRGQRLFLFSNYVVLHWSNKTDFLGFWFFLDSVKEQVDFCFYFLIVHDSSFTNWIQGEQKLDVCCSMLNKADKDRRGPNEELAWLAVDSSLFLYPPRLNCLVQKFQGAGHKKNSSGVSLKPTNSWEQRRHRATCPAWRIQRMPKCEVVWCPSISWKLWGRTLVQQGRKEGWGVPCSFLWITNSLKD